MGKKISQLSAAGSAVTTMKVEVENSSGVSQYVTLQQIYDAASFTLADGDYGDISIASGVWSIENNAVTFAKMQTVSTNVLLGNDGTGTAVQEITCTAAGRAILDDADAAAQRTTLGLAIGTNVQAWGADLDALEALSGTNTIYYRSGANTWSPVTIGSNLTFSGGTLSASGGGSGTVTSVGLSLPAVFSVSGSPVTTSGTLTGTLATQTANIVWAGPASGGAATPTFRALVAADLPTVPVAQGGTGLTSSGTSNQVLGVNNAGSGLEYKTITAGSNVTVTHGANSITIASTGGGGGTPAGSDTQVQYNNASAFGATSNFIVDTGGTNTALVRATSPSNTKPALRLQSNGASQTAPVLAVTDSSIDVFRVMRDGTINDATWGGNTIPTTKGGTGLTTLGTAGQTYRVNSGATGLEWFSGAAFGSQSSAVATGTLANGSSVDVTHASDPGFVRIPKFEIQRPSVSNAVFLCHWDGANNSTTFTDTVNSATITANGTAKLTTATSQFGTASLSLDGTGTCFASVSSSSNFQFATTDSWTIDFWLKLSATNVSYNVLNFGRGLIRISNGAFQVYQVNAGGSAAEFNVAGSCTLTTNWTHVRVCFTPSPNTIYVFLNGTLQSNNLANVFGGPAAFTGFGTAGLEVGRQDVGANYVNLNGNIDELFIVKGTALSTTSFTAPSSPWADSAWQPVKLSNSLISDTDCVDVQYADVNGANSSTTTRFTNRLGSSVTYRASVLLGSAPAGMLGPVSSSQTSSFTAATQLLYPVALSGVGAHLTVSFPATPAEGDWFGYWITSTNASFESVPNRNGNTIRGGTSVDEYRIWQVGEYLVWRFLSGTWQLVGDGRIPQFGTLTQVGSAQTVLPNFYQILFDTATGLGNASADRITFRRKCKIIACARFIGSGADATIMCLNKNGTTSSERVYQTLVSGSSSAIGNLRGGVLFADLEEIDFLPGDYLCFIIYPVGSSSTASTSVIDRPQLTAYEKLY